MRYLIIEQNRVTKETQVIAAFRDEEDALATTEELNGNPELSHNTYKLTYDRMGLDYTLVLKFEIRAEDLQTGAEEEVAVARDATYGKHTRQALVWNDRHKDKWLTLSYVD